MHNPSNITKQAAENRKYVVIRKVQVTNYLLQCIPMGYMQVITKEGYLETMHLDMFLLHNASLLS